MGNGLPVYTRLSASVTRTGRAAHFLDLLAAWASPLGRVVLAVVPLPEGWKPMRRARARAEQRTIRAGRSWVSLGCCSYRAEAPSGAMVDITLRAEPRLGQTSPSGADQGNAAPRLMRTVSRGVVHCGGHEGFFALGEVRQTWKQGLYPAGALTAEWTCPQTQRHLTLHVQGAADKELAAVLTLLANVRCH